MADDSLFFRRFVPEPLGIPGVLRRPDPRTKAPEPLTIVVHELGRAACRAVGLPYLIDLVLSPTKALHHSIGKLCVDASPAAIDALLTAYRNQVAPHARSIAAFACELPDRGRDMTSTELRTAYAQHLQFIARHDAMPFPPSDIELPAFLSEEAR